MKKLNQDNWQEMLATYFRLVMKTDGEVGTDILLTGNDICDLLPGFVAVAAWLAFSAGAPITVSNEETSTLTVEVAK